MERNRDIALAPLRRGPTLLYQIFVCPYLKSASLIPTRADDVPSKAHDPLDERLTRHLGGRHGHDIAALYAAIPGDPAIQEYVIGILGVGVQSGLHRDTLHPRHVTDRVAENDPDRDADENVTDET